MWNSMQLFRRPAPEICTWMFAWKLRIISIITLVVQYNCDFDLDLQLIEMSLRIYSCVSLIVPLSNDVHLPFSISNCVRVLCMNPKLNSMPKSRMQLTRTMLSLNCKIKWYNAREYFIINDFTMLNNFRKRPFPFQNLSHCIHISPCLFVSVITEHAMLV